MEKRTICDLVWDQEIYPRVDISSVHVARMVSALEAGEKLPSIVIEKKKNRIVDGVHRWRAYRTFLGEEAEVQVDVREYKTDNEAFLAAIELNASHGLSLTPFEITRNAVRAQERGITLQMLASAVHVPLAKIERRLETNTGFGRKLGMMVALKASMTALAGKKLSEKQLDANRFSGGMRPLYYINQLIGLVEAGLCEWGSDKEREALRKLLETLESKLKVAA